MRIANHNNQAPRSCRLSPINNLIRIWRWAKEEHPSLLLSCPETGVGAPAIAYSIRYATRATQILLNHGILRHHLGFTMCWDNFDHMLVERYGCRLCEIPFDPETPIEYFVPSIPDRMFPPALHRARIQRWSAIGCTVLHYSDDRYITATDLDATCRTFLYWFVMCVSNRLNRFVFVDAHAMFQRSLLEEIRNDNITWSRIIWLADSTATSMNITDTLDVPVETVSSFVCKDSSPDDSPHVVHSHTTGMSVMEQNALVVVGMHNLSATQQTELMRTIAITPRQDGGATLAVFLLGATASGGSVGIDPWSCCCAATGDCGPPEGCQQPIYQSFVKNEQSVCMFRQPTGARLPPHSPHKVSVNGGRGGWQWIEVPKAKCHRLASWFTNTVQLEPNAVVLTLSEYDCKIVSSVLAERASPDNIPPLQDQTIPIPSRGARVRCVLKTQHLRKGGIYHIRKYDPKKNEIQMQALQEPIVTLPVSEMQSHCRPIRTGLLYALPAIGQHIRCVRDAFTMTIGSVYCIVGYNPDDMVELQTTTGVIFIAPIAEMRLTCTLAWVGLLQNRLNCWYGTRPVYVLLSNPQSQAWQQQLIQDPLHLAYQLSTNVTIVAGSDRMRDATTSLCTEFDILPRSVWHDLLGFLTQNNCMDQKE
jgi:hypothetical protein